MSGGHFNYRQREIGYIAESIQSHPDEIIEKFKEAVDILRKAEVYAQRIDWYLSGDDGDETFIKRLKEDLEKL